MLKHGDEQILRLMGFGTPEEKEKQVAGAAVLFNTESTEIRSFTEKGAKKNLQVHSSPAGRHPR